MKTLIIGSGFCARELLQVIPHSQSTELPEFCTKSQIPLDINNENDWKTFLEYERCIITCKLTDSKRAAKLAQLLRNKCVILLSSAKCFKNSDIDGCISEDSPLSSNLRNDAEIYFSKFAYILHLGLLWGAERQVSNWLKRHRIKNGNKLVNFIHVNDVARIASIFLEHTASAGRYLISDGTPRHWREFSNSLEQTSTGLESRRFNTQKLQQQLPAEFDFAKPTPIT